MKVAFIQRKPHPGNHSLEELFRSVRNHLPNDCQAQLLQSPYLSLGLLARIRMSIYFMRRQQEVNHVTGDIHFVSLFLSKRSTLLTIHDCDKLLKSRGIKRFILWLFWFKLPMSRVSLVTTISQQTKNDLLNLVAFSEQRIRVIPNCISDIFTFSPGGFRNDYPRILAIGTKKNKNLIRLFQALENISCELTIIGRLSKTQQQNLKARNIDFRNLFEISHQRIFEEYKRSDLVILVSTREGFGLPISEAQAVGRPVVCSDLEPHRSVAGEGGARLVDPSDFGSIRTGILEVITNRSLREKMVATGLENAKKFSAREIAIRYYNVYRELSSNQG